MQFRRHTVPFALALALFGCGGAQPAFESIDGACLRNDACSGGELCVLGMCKLADGSLSLDLSGINAAQWFVYDDGQCSYDTDCGPWMCSEGACVAPNDTNRPTPAHAEFRYFDGSCNLTTDCGPWSCADGWCTQPGFESPSALGAPDASPPSGVSCLSDNQCPEDADCMFPGQCVAGAASERMTFADVAAREWFDNDDGSCTGDNECGPHVCDDGWCIAPEFAGIDLPGRSDFFFFDGSCSEDEHCDPWVCDEAGWCQHPDRSP